MNINYIIIRLHLFILSPKFPSLLTFIFLIVYKIYFEPAILCDDGCSPLLLDQLKKNLEEETDKACRISTSINEFNQIIEETKVKYGSLNASQRAYNDNKLLHLQEMLIKSLANAKEIGYTIRKIEPSYTSGQEGFIAGTLRDLENNRRR
jgi:hypothetical protein